MVLTEHRILYIAQKSDIFYVVLAIVTVYLLSVDFISVLLKKI